MPNKPWQCGAAMAALLACGAAHAATYASLDSTLDPYLARYDLPALAAAVVRDGRVIAAGAVGTRRVGATIPVTINDRFHLGSDAKAMTALLAAMLVEEGTLRWDSTVGEVFPELAGSMDSGLRGVTLTQLLSHTSGVAPDNQAFGDLVDKSVTQDGNLDELRYWLVREWGPQPLVSKPGTTFAYANMNYVIAGAIIERISGRTWDELITERVFTPLELRTAGLGAQSSLGRVDAPLGHAVVDGKTKAFLAGPNGDNPPIMGSAGIAHMSVLDFARWAGWNAGQGKRGPQLVQAETLQKLHTPVIAMPSKPDAPPGTPPGGAYALGWGQLSVDWAPSPLLYHGGSNGKNLAHVWVEPSRDFAIVVLTNISGQPVDDALRAVAAELYQRYAMAEAPTPAAEPESEPSGKGWGSIFSPPKKGPAPFGGDTRRGKGL
jgi:CubicO group peptidase (beta-lactamase class C family)